MMQELLCCVCTGVFTSSASTLVRVHAAKHMQEEYKHTGGELPAPDR